ncbi:DoxX family protein [Amycolatopsis sp. QT-25]|uniref:DoxX family protein n=1 Tax=Amycolatopsis sp. QT-25 TaxID=3034022 RepID=UPI0023EB29BB|nr:DoxX family protein [Amycolatopsis sp. QT-25]WET83321.1 DoxX family protein [Amycolatopsis sp. QT-25]
MISDVAEPGNGPAPTETRGGIDLGLLVLRVVLGVTMGAHGLQHLFGAFGGPGVGGFARVLGNFGYTQTTLLSWITGISEVVGGALVLVGLFTPVGAAALLGVCANIVYVKFGGGFFQKEGQGFEFELLLAAASLTVLLAGSGRIALDVNTPWRKRPLSFGLIGLVVAAAASVVVLVLCR